MENAEMIYNISEETRKAYNHKIVYQITNNYDQNMPNNGFGHETDEIVVDCYTTFEDVIDYSWELTYQTDGYGLYHAIILSENDVITQTFQIISDELTKDECTE